MISSLLSSLIIAFLLLRVRSLKQECRLMRNELKGMYLLGRQEALAETARPASEAEKAAYIKGIEDAHAALKPRKNP